MCGIAGVVDAAGPVAPGLVEAMCAAMIHRGPDGRGVHHDDGVALGAQRLAVIDPAGGAQPVSDERGDVVAVFNGEIYNHRELRRGLEARGHRFRAGVDTEVLVHLYEERGPALVHELRGMFAFAIWDRRRRRLLLARDRVGKKPLFWARRGDRLAFASELRALLLDPAIARRPDPAAIDAYLALGYVPDPLCAVAGVAKLPPACTLVLEPGVPERVERYWTLDRRPRAQDAPRGELEAELRDRLDDAVRVRLESDVPVGALLSGGVDSSAVVAAMTRHAPGRVRTFSVGFDDPAYDESRHARLVARHLATEHHELRLEPDALAVMPRLARHHGEPFGDSSAVAAFLVAEVAAREVTVVLTGDGGDESFAGYERYVAPARIARLDRLPVGVRRPPAAALVGLAAAVPRARRDRLRRIGRVVGMDPAARYADALLVFDADARRALLEGAPVGDAERRLRDAWQAPGTVAPLDRMLGVDVATYLPGDLLPKVDIATMAHSVEARSPFLDHELMEFAAGLPAGLKLDEGGGKAILRSALRGRLPDEIIDRPKMGFAVPVRPWLRDLPGLARDLLLDDGARTAAYVRRPEVKRLLGEHTAGARDHAGRIWALTMLEHWHREVLDA